MYLMMLRRNTEQIPVILFFQGWAQMCVGTVMWLTVKWAQSCMGTNMVKPKNVFHYFVELVEMNPLMYIIKDLG